jgi:hypothetical protein
MQNTYNCPPFSKMAAVIYIVFDSSYIIILGTPQKTSVSNFKPLCIVAAKL